MTQSKWLNEIFQQRSWRRKARVRALKRARFIEALEIRTMLAANPIALQFLANETIALEESPAAVAVAEGAGNGFVATWTSYAQGGGDTSGLGVYAQRFLTDGSPNGAAFLVNGAFTDGDQSAPDVASDAAGNFVIVWKSQDQDGDGVGIFGQRYAADGTLLGGAFPVNTVTAGDQENPTVAMDNDGNFVVAWQSEGQDGDGYGIYARRYAAGGAAVDAAEFLVNTITDGNQKTPTVSVARGNGNFVIAWEGDVVAAEESVEVLAHVYDSTGATIRAEFQVNTVTPRDQVTPDVAMDANGDFIVAWTTEGQPGSGSDIKSQLFDATGAAVGSEFRVNDTTLQGQVNPSVGIDADGNFLITWQSSHQDEFSWGIFGRAYDSTGVVLTTEFQVNTFAEQPQTNPGVGVNSAGNAVVIWQGLDDTHTPAVHAQRYQLPTPGHDFSSVGGEVVLSNYTVLDEASASAAVDANRNFVVVWQSYGDDGSGLGILGRRFDALGAPLGDAFVVNSTTTGNQSNPSVAMDAVGNFAVVWESEGQDGDGHGIFAQLFDAGGGTVASEFQVNSVWTGSQEQPVIAMDSDDGNFVVVWQGPDDDLRGIYAQRFDATGSPVGGEFAVNSFTDLDQVSPAVSMNAAGQFVVGWVSDHRATFDPEDSEKSIFLQWYDAAGTATGEEQLAHSIDPVAEAQEYPDVAIDGAGNFVAVWQSITQDGSAWGVYGRQFLANKTPVQPVEFLINQNTEENQRRATVAADPDGNFVVNWQSDLQDQAATAIISRQYNADGTPETDESLVNNWELGPQILPITAMTPDGDFGVFWLGQGTSRKEGIHGRIYEEGYVPPPPHIFVEPVGDQFMVDQAAGLEATSPSVAVIESTGNYVAAWTSFEQPDRDASGLGVYVQRFLVDGTPQGDVVLVNTTFTDDDQDAPAVAVDEAGNFVVVWESLGQDGDGFGIYGQRYAADGTLQGGAFQVNTVTADNQENPSVAMDNAGNFVIAWQSLGQDGDGYGVYARRYAATGDALDASEVLVNTTTDGNQVAAAVARARDGSQFIVAWQADVLTVVEEVVETEVEIYARLFAADGGTLVGEFQVNTISEKDQVIPDVAMSADGDFVVAWTSEGQVGSGADVFARRFNAAGVGQADDFRVNVTTGQGQQNPAVAIDGDGDFIVSWESSHQDGFSWGIFAQVYDSAGDVVVDEFQVNSNTQGPQIRPDVNANSDGDAVVVWLGLDAVHQPAIHGQRYTLPQPGEDFRVGPEGEIVLSNYVALEEAPAAVAVDADRNFVAVWQSYGEDGSGLGIFGRRLDPVGNPLEDSFLVTTTIDGNQSNPDVAADAAGNFTVVWQSAMQDGDGYGVFGRQFAFDGSALSGEFRVNSTIAGHQGVPSIAMDPDDGTFVVVWQGPDADGLGIFGQRYDADGTALGSEFQVNHFTDLDQVSASVSMNAAGQFVVVWVSDHRAVFDPTDTEKTIFAQWYDAEGTSVGDEVVVHSIQPEFEAQEYPDVAINPDGEFAVAFQSINQDGNTWGVFARQFLADKSPIQPIEFQVNQTVLAPQRSPSIVSDQAGNFVIAWQAHKQDASGPAVFSRVYDAAAVAQTDEFLVPTWDQGPQSLPVMAMTPSGDFGVFWTGHGVDRAEGVHGRIYNVAPALTSFTRHIPATGRTDADTLIFLATFNEDVTGVNASDFAVNGATTATVTNVNPTSASTYQVTVSGGNLASFNGVVGLDLAVGQDITDLDGSALPAGEPAIDETYTVDNIPVVQIIDDGDPGFTSTLMIYSSNGVVDVRYAGAGTGSSFATWTFPVSGGRYRVSATWLPHANRATDAPYTIFDGMTQVAQVDVNQELTPNDFTDAGRGWEDLATVDIFGTTLKVILTNDANEYVIADGVRIERIGDAVLAPEIQVLDGTTNIADQGTVNFGSTTPGTPVDKVLTVKNIGTENLTLTALDGGSFPAGFSLVQNIAQTTLAPQGQTTFTLRLSSASEGTFSGPINFANNDSDENPFDLNLHGTVFNVPPPPVVQIIDDGDPGFTSTGMIYASDGVVDVRYAAAGTGSSFATWTFPVSGGRYRVSATWLPHANRATDAPYTIFDGMTQVAQVDVNQELTPNDFTDAGRGWEDLATVDIVGTTLKVILTNDANEYVIADGVRIERVGVAVLAPEIQVLDGTTNIADQGTVNFGSTTPGTPVDKVLTVKNIGTENLTLTALDGGSFPAGFSLVQNIAQTTLAPQGQTTFTLRLSSASEGTFSGPINFANNDSDENPFDLNLHGTVFNVPPPPVVQIIDDGDPGFTSTGMIYASDGVVDVRYAAAGTGSSFATWTFPVSGGRYRVSATWLPHANRATDAPYTIFDGATQVAQVDVNQELTPNDFTDAGRGWEDLATVNIFATTLKVILTNDANEYVIADGVRIERIGDAVPAPLRASGGQALEATDDKLTADVIGPVLAEAIQLWNGTALSNAQHHALQGLSLAIADLPDGLLGASLGSTITVDVNAAGYGWFVDPSPADSAEFDATTRGTELLAPSSSDAFGRIDLLTLLTHELGHVVGKSHVDDVQHIMAAELATGVRRVPPQAPEAGGLQKTLDEVVRGDLVARLVRESLIQRSPTLEQDLLDSLLAKGDSAPVNAAAARADIFARLAEPAPKAVSSARGNSQTDDRLFDLRFETEPGEDLIEALAAARICHS